MPLGVVVGVGLAVAFGAMLQRISGMGMGLIAAPVLSLLLGPVDGVLMVNLIAVVNAVMNTLSMRSDVDWRKALPIAAALILGVVPGARVITRMSSDLLLVVVGVLLLAALSVVTLGKRYVPRAEGTAPAVVAGAVGGFMNTLAGVAGPAITVYAQAARWDQRTYAATLQPIFLVGGTLSFVGKELSGAADVTAIPGILWATTLCALAAGIVAGKRLAPRVPAVRARRIALGLAFFGGATALVRGLIGGISAL
ncbi:permease [Corynebacterium sp. BCW_4722]|nr:permease [Corynebacterium sp. BCW_4722]